MATKKEQATPQSIKIGEVTQELIESWKKQYDIKKVPFFEVVQEGETEISIVYLKPAGRDILAQVMSLYSNGKTIEAGEIILANCWLAGDERIKNPVGLRQERTAVRGAQLAFGAVTLPEGYAGEKK